MAAISDSKNLASVQQVAAIEQLWLTYYNDTLFSKGLITEEQRNRIRLMIKNRPPNKTK